MMNNFNNVYTATTYDIPLPLQVFVYVIVFTTYLAYSPEAHAAFDSLTPILAQLLRDTHHLYMALLDGRNLLNALLDTIPRNTQNWHVINHANDVNYYITLCDLILQRITNSRLEIADIFRSIRNMHTGSTPIQAYELFVRINELSHNLLSMNRDLIRLEDLGMLNFPDVPSAYRDVIMEPCNIMTDLAYTGHQAVQAVTRFDGVFRNLYLT